MRWCMAPCMVMHGDVLGICLLHPFASFCHLLLLWTPCRARDSWGVNMCQHVSTLPCFWGTFFWDHESLGSKLHGLHGICCIQLSHFLQDFLLQEEIERERERWNLSMADPSKPVAVSMAFHGFPWVPPSKMRLGPWLTNVQVSESVKSVRRNESDEKKSQCLNYYHWVLPWCYLCLRTACWICWFLECKMLLKQLKLYGVALVLGDSVNARSAKRKGWSKGKRRTGSWNGSRVLVRHYWLNISNQRQDALEFSGQFQQFSLAHYYSYLAKISCGLLLLIQIFVGWFLLVSFERWCRFWGSGVRVAFFHWVPW